MRLLIAEDDPRLLRSLAHIFETEGYLVDAVARGDDALAFAESGEYDGLVLDIMMPGRDGVSVLQALRERGISTPALFLTAKDGVAERVQGLDAGADNYLAKPFSTSELLARVRAMLRRKDTYTPDLLEACGLVLDRSTFELSAGSDRLSLSAKEYQIVEFFMNHAGMIISADKVLTHIWGWESDVSMSVLWVHISNIRKKLAALGAPASIRFVRGAATSSKQARMRAHHDLSSAQKIHTHLHVLISRGVRCALWRDLHAHQPADNARPRRSGEYHRRKRWSLSWLRQSRSGTGWSAGQHHTGIAVHHALFHRALRRRWRSDHWPTATRAAGATAFAIF